MSKHGPSGHSTGPSTSQGAAVAVGRARVPAGWLTGATVAAAAGTGIAGIAGGALAQDGPAEDAATERSQAFKAVEGAVEEDVPGGPLLVGAYAVVLTLLVLYVIRVTRLQQRVDADLARLEGALRKAGAGEPSDG